MKLLNNKKAIENWVPDTMPFFILFVIVLGFSVLLFLLIIHSFVSDDLQIPKGVEEYILKERFYNSPDCFAYQEEVTNRVYLKSIELDKFKNKNTINKCISSRNNYAFKLELENPETKQNVVLITSNWVESASFRLEQKDVFVYSKNEIVGQKLSIYIQNV